VKKNSEEFVRMVSVIFFRVWGWGMIRVEGVAGTDKK